MAPIRATPDYYEYMGIARDADDNQIKAVYRRLAKLYHPDRNRGNDEATAKFQTLQEAYSTLIDIEKRRQYNQIYPSIRTKYPRTSTGARDTAQDNDASVRAFQEQIISIDRELQALYQSLNRTKGVLKGSQGSLDEVSAALQRLDLEDKEDQAAEASNNGWYSYFFGGQKASAEEQARKIDRARRQTERRVGRLVHESKRSRHRDDIERLQGNVRDLETKVERKEVQRKFVLQQREDAKRAAEWARVYAEQQAARQRKQEQEQKAQEEEQRAQERSRKFREESRRFEEAIRKSQEEAWKARADECRNRQRDEKARKEREEMFRKANAERAKEREQICKEKAERARKEREEKVRKEKAEKAQIEIIERARKASEEKARRDRDANTRREAETVEFEKWLEKAREHAKKSQEAAAARKWETEILTQTGKPKGKGKTPHRAPPTAASSASPRDWSTCLHKKWWTKVDGRHFCEHCEELTTRFSFKCPDCLTMACGSCMRTLKA